MTTTANRPTGRVDRVTAVDPARWPDVAAVPHHRLRAAVARQLFTATARRLARRRLHARSPDAAEGDRVMGARARWVVGAAAVAVALGSGAALFAASMRDAQVARRIRAVFAPHETPEMVLV